MVREVPICFMLERQVVIRAFSRACAKTGKRIAARMAMMAITTSSSIKVNAGLRVRCMHDLLCRRGAHALPVPASEQCEARVDSALVRPLIPSFRLAAAFFLLEA